MQWWCHAVARTVSVSLVSFFLLPVHYGAAASQAAPTIKAGADKLSDFTGSPLIQHVVTVMLTVAGGLLLVGWATSLLDQKRLA